jgi:YD repeat-containing protein
VAMPSEWQRLITTEEKDFNQGDSVSYLDTYTHYFYDNPAHMQVTRAVTTNSKGQVVTTATQYPLDFPNPVATDPFTLGVARLQQSHVVNRPVENHVDKVNADGTNQRTTSAFLTYFNAGSPTENAVYRTENTSPITGFAPAAISSSGLSSSPFYTPFIYFDQYDSHGNILQQRKANDLAHSYIWDYASSLLIAEATNASQSDIAYTSFESDGTGNWNLSSSITNNAAITGTKCYSLGNGTISKTGLQIGNTYVVSYWSQNGAYSLSWGTGAVKTGRSVSGWTYYEHTVVATSATLTISGGGNVDELRLYPASAQMTTYSYAPLIGITSQCDAGSRITYYEYDGLGRLQDVKDQDGNILKTYEYQYRVSAANGGQE